MPFIKLKKFVPFYSWFAKSLSWRNVLLFLYQLKLSCDISPLASLKLIDILILNQLYNPRVNPMSSWLWYYYCLYCWIWFHSLLLRIFYICVHKGYCYVVFFLYSLSGFDINTVGFIKWEVFVYFLEEIKWLVLLLWVFGRIL